MSQSGSLVCVGVALVFAAGCSGAASTAPTKVAVTGTVTVNGKPMADGEIVFDVAGGQVPVRLEIRDGSFAGEAFAGKNRVEVNAYKNGPPLSTDPEKKPTRVNTIDPRFNFQTTLTAEVTPGGTNEFKFAVRSK